MQGLKRQTISIFDIIHMRFYRKIQVEYLKQVASLFCQLDRQWYKCFFACKILILFTCVNAAIIGLFLADRCIVCGRNYLIVVFYNIHITRISVKHFGKNTFKRRLLTIDNQCSPTERGAGKFTMHYN